MKTTILAAFLASGAALGAVTAAGAQQASPGASVADGPGAGVIVRPSSSQPNATQDGRRARTHLRIMIPPAGATPPSAAPSSQSGPPTAGSFFETPASIACVYGVAAGPSGCSPTSALTNSSRGARAIAIVDAYDYTNAQADLAAFSKQFGLPAPTSSNFKVVYASGSQPPNGAGSGWDIEASLDIEYAHGLAPKAKIFLVETNSNSYSDLFAGVTKAAQLVAAAGGGEVSMSWGGSEFSSETSFDSYFKGSKVVFFASSGDEAGTEYPCVSPNVVCVGGTSNSRNQQTGKLQAQAAWVDTGGGASAYEKRPSYQKGIASVVKVRGVPDVAAIADPRTGAWVYNSTYYGYGRWLIVGGTSLASPVTAAIANAAATFRASSASELAVIYATLGKSGAGWTDVTLGYCGFYLGDAAGSGWDLCTGLGTPAGLSNKLAGE